MDLYEQYGRQLRESNAQNLMLRYSKKKKKKKKKKNLSVSEKVEKNMECVCAGLTKKRKQGIYLIKKYRNKNKYLTTIKK